MGLRLPRPYCLPVSRMPEFADLIRQGAGHAWLFIPSAILLGALHGLEPGHSKTMMASFIVAVRGTVGQAVILGLAATLSHTAVVWLVALVGLYLGRELAGERVEGWFQLLSALIMLAMAAWLFAPVWRRHRAAQAHHDHDHDHGHGGHHHHPAHDHDDAHARFHAEQIAQRFADGQATTRQVILFGLTGGLIPCPAAITVLLICLQLREFTLGVALVLCFSIGLALTLTASGVVAALGARHLSKRGYGFEKLMARAPAISALLILVIAAYMGWHGMVSLTG